MDEWVQPPVFCKVCGHRAENHRYATQAVCMSCPGLVCQDGPVGQRYRSVAVTARL